MSMSVLSVASDAPSKPLSQLGHIGRATYPDLSQSVLEVYKILLGQDFSQWRARTTASRLVVATWLVVALVVGVAYRGNLTASLTSPMYPPRPETAAEMVRVVERCVDEGARRNKRSEFLSKYSFNFLDDRGYYFYRDCIYSYIYMHLTVPVW